MEEALHYLLMSNHHMIRKELFSRLRDTEMTPGQPKVLDYLIDHDGAIQKDLAAVSYIEPATLTTILRGMEDKGLIRREMKGDDRRCLIVWMTPKGKDCARRVKEEFEQIERRALAGFTPQEAETLRDLLIRLRENNLKDQEK